VILACSGCGDAAEGQLVDGEWICISCQAFPPARPTEPSGPLEPSEALPTLRAEQLYGSRRRSIGERDSSVGSSRGDNPAANEDCDRTARQARTLGIEVEDGGLRRLAAFRCVLPGHADLARLHPAGGRWRYRCENDDRSWGLAEIRAFQGYRETRAISRTQSARWRERLEYEAGLLARGPIPAGLPASAPAALRKVADGWALLVGLRDPPKWRNEPFVFARPFVMAWCGVTDEQARRAVRQLEDLRILRRVGSQKGAILWRPGTAGSMLAVHGSEEAIVSAFIEEFDAVEVAG
jgi:hypothetical protein